MTAPLPPIPKETNRLDLLLDAFSRHLLLADAVKIGTHDPLGCSECIHWCRQLAELEPRPSRHSFAIDDSDPLEIELRPGL